jgi:hypothetical protein
MDKINRGIPERGALFTSKYANRHGNGLPIFTTERAFERKHQVRLLNEKKDLFIAAGKSLADAPSFDWE